MTNQPTRQPKHHRVREVLDDQHVLLACGWTARRDELEQKPRRFIVCDDCYRATTFESDHDQ